jgi:hypothetical protein
MCANLRYNLGHGNISGQMGKTSGINAVAKTAGPHKPELLRLCPVKLLHPLFPAWVEALAALAGNGGGNYTAWCNRSGY